MTISKELKNYYEIERFCKSEGLNTEYFILQVNRNKSKKTNSVFALLAAIFVR